MTTKFKFVILLITQALPRKGHFLFQYMEDKIISENIQAPTNVEKINAFSTAHLLTETSLRIGSTKRKVKSLIGKVFNNSGGNNSSNKKILILIAFVVIVMGALGTLLFLGGSGSSTLGTQDTRPSSTTAKAKQNINKIFQFPIRDEKGKEVSKFSYEVMSAELYDSIIVKGQRANAIKGRTFLIINLKISNSNNQPVSINTRDYLRLSVNSSNELIAPDIHNDPVEAQAISTKYTRAGVAINDSDKDIILNVGEITGIKESIKINFN